MSKFKVDTHLFRELGQMLVGRDSTALIELVKNAYDADATKVIVYGEALDDPDRGYIAIQDDGIGMDGPTFERGFLRIASRVKEEGDRRSVRFKRRYTGAKGIGRLAAHKLARELYLTSVPAVNYGAGRHGVEARIYWDQVEACETLDQIDDKAVRVDPTLPLGEPGTKIVLRKLRQPWTGAQLTQFVAEVAGLQVPRVLSEPLPAGLLPENGLFEGPRVRDSANIDPGFHAELEGQFAVGEDYWPAYVQSTHWVIDIDVHGKNVTYLIAPTSTQKKKNPRTQRHIIREVVTTNHSKIAFQARILIREGSAKKEFKAFHRLVSGIRVYQEGFRVLPYGELGDDWLFLDRDTIDRSRTLKFVDDSDLAEWSTPDEGLHLLPTKHYLGAVCLTAEGVPDLDMLVNREGFLPSAEFERLRTIIRRGINLTTRIRAATSASENAPVSPLPTSDTELPAAPPRTKPASPREQAAEVKKTIDALPARTEELRVMAAKLEPLDRQKLEQYTEDVTKVQRASQKMMNDISLIRVLASVGTQLAAFVHEINRVLAMAQTVEDVAKKLRESVRQDEKAQKKVSRLIGFLEDLRRAIEQQASYFGDILSPDARRRKSRLAIAQQFDVCIRLIQHLADKRSVSIENRIPPQLRSPLMYPAQLMAVFTNLVTNAIKAAGESGRIRATGKDGPHGSVSVRLENTGIPVDLDDAERWFKPFESTTTDIDPVLGQGMGLGLGITRDILGELGATIQFVKPIKGFATAIEIDFPG